MYNYYGVYCNDCFFYIAGLPAISFIGGYTEDGLPIGLQLIGKWTDESTLINVARNMELLL